VILVTGANGFVGRHVVRTLVSGGARVRGMVRDVEGARDLAGVDCELVRGDVTEPESLPAAVEGCEAVVNLVAIIAGRPADFERTIAQGTRNLLAAGRAATVARWVQMSVLGTSRETKDLVPYYGAKWAAEEAVHGSGLPHAILRPSFVFGPDGGILPRLARIARLAPVTPVIGPGTQRLQPIWVDDVARAISLALEHDGGYWTEPPGEPQRLIELGGPDVVDWNELWSRLKTALGTRRPSLHLPYWFVRPQAVVLERLPSPPLTRDQLTMLAGPDNVVGDGGRSQRQLGLEDVVPLDEQLSRGVG
jgi:uncharacterized protein YbjT (DUF2867 family)